MTDFKKSGAKRRSHVVRPVSWPDPPVTPEARAGIKWHLWALGMCRLLDKIEGVYDDPEAVHKLCQDRFELAREHGLTVEIIGLTSGTDQ